MADDNPTGSEGETGDPKEKEKNPTPTLAAEIAKHVVAALSPQPEASSSKGKRDRMVTPPHTHLPFFHLRV
jgi:hypothetical protein